MTWFAGFEPIVTPDVPLREYTWYRLGGVARWMCEPRSAEELTAVLARAGDAGLSWRVLGHGANVLVRDSGFDGVVFRLAAPAFDRAEYVEDGAWVGAGADFPKLIRATINRGLVGLERLAGIPGTLGGVVRMNAGGKYGEIREFVELVRLVDQNLSIVERRADEVGFRYRHTDLDGCIVLAARLRLERGETEAALQRHRDIWNEKYDSQPAVKERSAGCVFKNPAGGKAGRLLDESGLKGVRVGAAEISTRHANFIVAHDGATAQNVIDLIALAQERVRSATGIELQTEVEIW